MSVQKQLLGAIVLLFVSFFVTRWFVLQQFSGMDAGKNVRAPNARQAAGAVQIRAILKKFAQIERRDANERDTTAGTLRLNGLRLDELAQIPADQRPPLTEELSRLPNMETDASRKAALQAAVDRVLAALEP